MYVQNAGYAVYDWYTFDEDNDIDNYEDEKSVAMCVGFGSMIMFFILTTEIVLTLCSADNLKMWSIAFIVGSIISAVITLAGGCVQVDTLENSNADEKYNNFLFYNFVLVSAPIAYRSLLVFMKLRDMCTGTSRYSSQESK